MASPEYYEYINSKKWKGRSRFYQFITAGRCSIFPWLPANCSHHLTYDNLYKEVYWRDCIPLSNAVHQWIHFGKVGAYYWQDQHGRRRKMNAVLRTVAALVTLVATLCIPIRFGLFLLTLPKKINRAIKRFKKQPILKKRRSA